MSGDIIIITVGGGEVSRQVSLACRGSAQGYC